MLGYFSTPSHHTPYQQVSQDHLDSAQRVDSTSEAYKKLYRASEQNTFEPTKVEYH